MTVKDLIIKLLSFDTDMEVSIEDYDGNKHTIDMFIITPDDKLKIIGDMLHD